MKIVILLTNLQALFYLWHKRAVTASVSCSLGAKVYINFEQQFCVAI